MLWRAKSLTDRAGHLLAAVPVLIIANVSVTNAFTPVVDVTGLLHAGLYVLTAFARWATSGSAVTAARRTWSSPGCCCSRPRRS